MNAEVLSALAEPNRLQIVELLLESSFTVGEIAERLEMRQPQASKHVKVLNDAGIIEVKAVANRRICSLRPEPFKDLNTWIESYRRLWEERYDRLDDYLQQLQNREKGH
ncbi:metalloregulator ArsR/SmtB family transcription factor [Paenibacillus sp. NEAU-GSW1]|nr:metalloregulator ArsR/SmtB family transcription factor [Paenibacillus sp. NEAU-GSW1]